MQNLGVPCPETGEHYELRGPAAPLPPPSYQARAFIPDEAPPEGSIEPDEALQAWSNRLRARHGGAA